MGVAILSQICDSGRVFGTARHRVPPFLAESGRITWLFRITGLTGPLPGGGWRVHTVLRLRPEAAGGEAVTVTADGQSLAAAQDQ